MKITFIFNLKFYQIFDKKRKRNFGSKFFEIYRILNDLSPLSRKNTFLFPAYIYNYYASFTIYSLPILLSNFILKSSITKPPSPFHSPPPSIILFLSIFLSLSLFVPNPNLLPSFLLFHSFRQSFLKKEKEKKISRSGAIHDVTQLIRVTD